MKKEVFDKAKRLREQIDYLEGQNEALRQAQSVLRGTDKKPDDVFRFFVTIAQGEYGTKLIEDIVFGLIRENDKRSKEIQAEFDAL